MKKKVSLSTLQMDLFGGCDYAVIDTPVVVPKIISEKKEVVERIEQAFEEQAKSKRALFELLDEHLACLSSSRSKVQANIRAIEILQQSGPKTVEEKAALPIVVTELGMVTEVIAVPLKASSPIVVTEPGISTEAN